MLALLAPVEFIFRLDVAEDRGFRRTIRDLVRHETILDLEDVVISAVTGIHARFQKYIRVAASDEKS